MTLGKILRKSIIPVATGVLTFFPSKSNAQGPPVDLPSELRGFVEPHELVIDSLFAYNKTNDLLLDGTVLSLADTVTAAGDTVRNVPNFYRLIIPTDKASTPDIVEGATAGDTLDFKVKLTDGGFYALIPTTGPVTHEPGQIKRVDMYPDIPVAVEEPRNNLPSDYTLKAYPNPFNPQTMLKYEVPKRTKVSLAVYDGLGREVIRLVDRESKTAGTYNVQWDGRGKNGMPVASGMYHIKFWAPGGIHKTTKVTLMR